MTVTPQITIEGTRRGLRLGHVQGSPNRLAQNGRWGKSRSGPITKSLCSHPGRMTPHLNLEDRLVSDDNTEEENSLARRNEEKRKDPCPKKRKFSRRWREKLALLTQVGTPGNTRPQIGQMCLTMVGKINEDVGQIGVITSCTPLMVAVTLLRAVGNVTMTQLKRPSSLILLETGLIVVQELDGSVWIRRDSNSADKANGLDGKVENKH